METSEYKECAVSCTFSVGPTGANLSGWISYYSGDKIDFEANEISERWGLAAAMGVLPIVATAAFGWGAKGEVRYQFGS